MLPKVSNIPFGNVVLEEDTVETLEHHCAFVGCVALLIGLFIALIVLIVLYVKKA